MDEEAGATGELFGAAGPDVVPEPGGPGPRAVATRNRATPARALARALALDRVLIYAWLFARLRYHQEMNQLIDALAQFSQRLGLDQLVHALHGLRLPPKDASDVEWQRFADELQALMIRQRNIGQVWNFTEEQLKRLEQYEQATVFLAECLQLAAVSDRQAVENRLLLPPS